MFHHFHNDQLPRSQGSISAQDFEELLEFVGIERILSPNEWLRRLQLGRLGETDLCLSFDDALVSQMEVALPVLEHHKLTAFWFVYSGVFEGVPSRLECYRAFRCQYFSDIEIFYREFFDRVQQSPFHAKANHALAKADIALVQRRYPVYSVNDVRFRILRDEALPSAVYEQLMDEMIAAHGASIESLAKNLWMTNAHLQHLQKHGHVLGLHSYSHPTTMATLPVASQQEEYERNIVHLERISGMRSVAMAHPTNSYSDTTLDILRGLGIACGFRANMFPKVAGEPLSKNALELAREDHSNIMRLIRSTKNTYEDQQS